MELKIAFFGASLVSSHGNEAVNYFRGLLKALHYNGHKVCFYEPDALDRLAHRDFERPEYAKVIVYPASAHALMEILQEAADADLIIKISGVGVLDSELEKGVACLKHMGKTIAYWDFNPVANLERINTNPSDPFRKLIPQYDFIFISGGGQEATDSYLALGAQNCHLIYPGADLPSLENRNPDFDFKYDLGFFTNKYVLKESKVTSYFFDSALTLAEQSFLFAGKGWENKEMYGNITYVNPLPMDQYPEHYSSCKCVLELHNDHALKHGYSPSPQLFEAAGAGSCVITEYCQGIEQFFEIGKEILVAKSGEELTEILKNLSKKEAIAIGQAAAAKVKHLHTYAQRAIAFEQIISSKEIPATKQYISTP